jgi:hypothetical protein
MRKQRSPSIGYAAALWRYRFRRFSMGPRLRGDDDYAAAFLAARLRRESFGSATSAR